MTAERPPPTATATLARPLPADLRWRFIAWGVAMLALLTVFVVRVAPNLKIETDILALLPHTQRDAQLDEALDAFSARLARRQIFLIGAPTTDEARLAARAFARTLDESGAFANVQLEVDADVRSRFDVYVRHRAWLLSDEAAAALESGEHEALIQRALRAAYTPAGLMQPLGLAEDPLGLLNDFLRGRTPAAGAARLDGAMLVVEREAQSFIVIVTESGGSAFAKSVQQRVLPAIEDARIAAQRSVATPLDIVSSGAVLHAAAATQRAEHEISTFGTIELVAVLLLLWIILGALRPLVLGALTLAMAAIAAITVVHFVFGPVHILALVFGSSLIGSVIDYSIHFFADRFREPRRWSPIDAARHVSPAILLGLTTTLIGYIALALVPFPGLQQIAVFCMAGLIVGCGCVLCFYPVFTPPARRAPPQLGPRIAAALDRFVQRQHFRGWRLGALLALVALTIVGLTRVQIHDDVRALQRSPAELVQAEQRVRELLGSSFESRYFVVTATDEQALLEQELKLTAGLDRLIEQQSLSSYEAVSRGAPTLARQQSNHTLLAQHVYAPDGLLERVMRTLGFAPDAIERRRAEFHSAQAPLTVETWLASPASESARHLWLGKVGERYASIVTLGGVSDVPALSALAADVEGARFIDPVTGTSEVMRSYRRVMAMTLALVYVAAGVVLLFRFGWREAPRMLLPAAAATAVTLGLFGWIGEPVNLFTLLALWLVLGLSIDYGIFLRHGASARTTAVLSVTLSACTTLLAFGLLAFSATPFIHTIGLTLLCAITLSWLFVLFTCPVKASG